MKMNQDPWKPVTTVQPLQGNIPDPRTNYPSSERHIASLEAKLARLKGKTREPTPRDMIRVLSQAKEDQMRRLVQDVTHAQLDVADESEVTSQSAIQRRLHPERQALNAEELKVLVEEDELQKKVLEAEAVTMAAQEAEAVVPR